MCFSSQETEVPKKNPESSKANPEHCWRWEVEILLFWYCLAHSACSYVTAEQQNVWERKGGWSSWKINTQSTQCMSLESGDGLRRGAQSWWECRELQQWAVEEEKFETEPSHFFQPSVTTGLRDGFMVSLSAGAVSQTHPSEVVKTR